MRWGVTGSLPRADLLDFGEGVESVGRESRKRRRKKAAKRKGARRARDAAEWPPWGSWPVSGAYMSYLDAFRICGQGLMFFCRKSPGGRFTFLVSTLDFFRAGLVDTAIVHNMSEGRFREEFLGGSAVKGGYLMKPAAPETVRKIFWGAYEFMRKQGYELPSREVANVRVLIPTPPKGPKGWLNALTGPDGLLDRRLLEVARRSQGETELPGDKEPIVVTTARFQADDADAALAWMRDAEPEICEVGPEEEGIHFDWTRAYPKRHWNPLARWSGARQSLGDVVLSGSEIRVETRSASWAARFAQLLHEKLGTGVRLVDVHWQPWQDLIGRSQRED